MAKKTHIKLFKNEDEKKKFEEKFKAKGWKVKRWQDQQTIKKAS